MAYYESKRTKYNNRWFKSNLEAKTAQALDSLNIRWEYESRCFRSPLYSGGQYTPDFWLPDNRMYLEVVGRLDERHKHNASVFWLQEHVSVPREDDFNARLLDDDNVTLLFVIGNGQLAVPNQRRGEYIVTTFCPKCGRISPSHSKGGYGCKLCGHRDGDHLLRSGNLFELAGIAHG